MSFEMSLMIVAPQMVVLGGACFALIVGGAFNSSLSSVKVPLVSLVAAILLSILNLGEDGVFFNGHLYKDDARDAINVLVYSVGLIWILYSSELSESDLKAELWGLKLFLILGIIVTVGAASFVTAFMGLELIALPMYTITALNSVRVKSAIECLINGLIGMSVILYGMSFVYGVTGSIYFSQVYEQINFVMVDSSVRSQLTLLFGLVMVGIGLSFKISSLPFNLVSVSRKYLPILIQDGYISKEN